MKLKFHVKVIDLKFPRSKLTFLLNSFQYSGQHRRRSLWKGELLRQVQQTEAWRRKQQIIIMMIKMTADVLVVSNTSWGISTVGRIMIREQLHSQFQLQCFRCKRKYCSCLRASGTFFSHMPT